MDKPRIFPQPAADAGSSLEASWSVWQRANLRLHHAQAELHREIQLASNELREQRRTLESHESLAQVGKIAAHVAHEARGELSSAAHFVDLLRHRLTDAGCLDLVEKIEDSLATVESTLTALLNLTGNREPLLERVNVRSIVDEVCQTLGGQLDERDIETVTDVPRNLAVVADREMLHAAVRNLVINALDAMPAGGRLVITSYIGPSGLELEVGDSGPGLSEEVRRRAFEPFFTTKDGSSGLGLSVVRQFAALHGGDVVAMNCPEGGAAFTLRLPQTACKAAA